MAEDARSELLGLVAGRKERVSDKSRVSALFSSSEDEEGELEQAGEPHAPQRASYSSASTGGYASVDASEEEDDGYDADFMGDDDDRARLTAMPEVEREAVLYERAQARAAKAERRALAEKMRQLEATSLTTGRTQRAPSAATTRKRQTLEELKAARLERQQTGKITQTRRRRTSDSDSEYSASDAESVDGDSGKRARGAIRDDEGSAAPLDLALVEAMRISRDDVCRLAAHPEFEELAQGCVMRLSVGTRPGTGETVYRLVEVRRIVPYHRAYRIAHSSGADASGTTTNKAALLRYGRQEKTFRLDFISNAPFEAAEFERWLATMHEEGMPVVSRRSAEARAAAWRDLVARPLSDAVITAMIAAKRDLGVAPRETAAERRVRLFRERDEALAEDRPEDAARIDIELDAAANGPASSAPPVRKRTLLAPSSATLAGSRATDLRLDPFSRRKCQPAAQHFADDPTGASPVPAAIQPPPAAAASPKAATETPKAVPARSTADAHLAIDLDLDD